MSQGPPDLVIVEDEADARTALAELLEIEGFHVIPCADAQAALAALSSFPEAVLVTDVGLPVMNGIALGFEALRLHPTCRVIITSGYPRDHAAVLPGWEWLQKPITLDDLTAAIGRVSYGDSR